MSIQYIRLTEINGPLIALSGVKNVAYEEMAAIVLPSGEQRLCRVTQIVGDKVLLQVFQGTNGISLINSELEFTGRPMEIPVSREMLGRTFDGVGRPVDGHGQIYSSARRNINGEPINPVSREYPQNLIRTGISSMDLLCTLIRGQKLPIFSGSGMPHNQLAAQIVRQAEIAKDEGARFAVVFAAMGVKNDVADFFRRTFEQSGALEHVVMFLNLANAPIAERIITPRCALTAAEHLAYGEGMHVLVIMTDMTSYAEALRELSSSKGEIPGRKGFPGYLYSDFASLYERAGIIKGKPGSVTQIPILTMPGDDITHPIPDLTGYITEGQIVFERGLHQRGVYPPVAVLPSLSRLMKDGIGSGYTRDDHPDVANQMFSAYSRVQDVRALASVIGEDELSPTDRLYIEFGKRFEDMILTQKFDENRSLEFTLTLAWRLLSMLPRDELERIDQKYIDKYYNVDIEAAGKSAAEREAG